MYHHQAMKELDRADFVMAVQKEMDDQMADGNFETIH